MTKTQTEPLKDRVVRIQCTDTQWKNLRTLAITRDEEIRSLITWAVRTSGITKKAFEDAA